MAIARPKGVFDITPGATEQWQDSALWLMLEEKIRTIAERYNFREIRTPAFERTELFARGVGETSDIVSKEMYTFEDKGGRSMSLRPEGTASVIRAFIDNGLHQRAGVQKLSYLFPMWRYERQQAGRYRQHHQFGVEVIGDDSPERDVEVLDLLMTLFGELGLSHLSLQINSIGNVESRIKYREALKEFLRPRLSTLSADSQNRFEVNPLRILDSKAPEDQEAIHGAPSLLDFLSPECRAHFEAIQKGLKALKIPFEVNPHLVRGLDYYNRTVFEITAGELGAQNSLVGGGRYDGLIKALGGPDLPALGFGCGLERVIQTLLGQKVPLPTPPHPRLVFLPLGEAAKERAFFLLKEVRERGMAAEIDLSGKKLKGALKWAVQLGADYVAVIGENEIEREVCQLKHLANHTEEEIPFQQLIERIEHV